MKNNIKLAEVLSEKNIKIIDIIKIYIYINAVNHIVLLFLTIIESILNTKGYSIDVNLLYASKGEYIKASLGLYLRVFIIGPVIEELIFRGGILKWLKKYGVKFAIVVQALIFAILHNNLMQVVPTFIVGISLGYIAVMTNSILVTIIIHMINNSFTGLIQMIILKNVSIASPIYIIMSISYVIMGVITLYHSKWKVILENTINIDIKEFFSRNKQQKIRRGKYEP
ncbi:CPBP family intramembrane metalloprotease [Tissierella carlieri]|uniref:CPBP family intramembrane metalloprotease n=1 Tax=Tissierella carlieri TaxID=689904 RepID=A0ABT1S972_9FIRM|nr:CPBP family intramembrane glutamic endopeptidase [Tissierella carlieri]MCQ4922897.1 CPBP family intramembrane metalloprotease [Tissierella carlieri]